MRVLEVASNFDLASLRPVARREPPQPGPGQALVRMTAVALNFRDLMVVTGHDRWRPPVGRIPGSDGVGVVQSVGPETERIKVGQRVMTTILPNWISGRSRCGSAKAVSAARRRTG